ncbi:MAG TPA: gamma-glutamylcyclotransferase [Acidimicrobiales bacterium]|nr:gamma-glutamylcyclotransferase [Acidimicrobiales bacterium]
MSELVHLFVNGEGMSGGSVHHAIANAKFLGDVATAPRYRFFSVRDEFPGLFLVEENGVPVPGELYETDYATVRDRLLPEEPAELELSIIELADGAGALGLHLRKTALGAPGVTDISALGGWRAYRASRDRG